MLQAHAISAAARSGLLALGAVVVCGVTGCGVEIPRPTVDIVEPSRGWNGQDTLVTIRGAQFYPQVELDAGKRGGADLDADFSAWLEGPHASAETFHLSGVSAIDTESLRAIVDRGMEVGVYDLVVEGPTGRRGRLADAFIVSDTLADHIAVEASTFFWEVNDEARIEVKLLDQDNEQVPTELPIVFVVTAADMTTVPVTYGESSGLEDPSVEGSTLTGDLGADGTATVRLSVPQPGTYTINARPTDPDSPVNAGSLTLVFEPGSDLVLDIRLPDDPFVAEAGKKFVVELELQDQFGNPVPDEDEIVELGNRCNTWVDHFQVSGPTTIEVQLDRACEGDAIVTDEVSTVQGASPDFDVVAGPVDHFQVDVLLSPITAGDTLFAQVVPVDLYANQAIWSGTLTLQDSVGGLGPADCQVNGNVSTCTAQATVAGDDVVLTASDGGLLGQSSFYDVLPGSVVGSVELTVPGSVEAGTAFDAFVILRDVWGNAMDATAFGAGAAAVFDELGEGDCVFAAFTPTGSIEVDCTLYTARAGAVLSTTVNGVFGASAGFTVNNGALASVTVTATGPIVAGEGTTITLTGTDAWANPYIVQTDPTLVLSDTSGTLSVVSAVLGPAGTIAKVANVTAAGTTVITASQGGVPLGSSSPLSVLAGPTKALRVTVLEPWAWQDVPTDVRVETIDAFGNRTEAGGTATIESRSTSTGPLAVALVNGIATVQYTWTEAALDDVLEGSTTGGITGESAPLHVVIDCVAGGPTIALAFGGFPEALACYDEAAGQATIAASFLGSTSGGAPISTYVLAVLGGAQASANLPTVLLDLPAIGIHPLAGLAVQSDLCAAELAATAYVGLDDGRPVGPIPMTPLTTPLDAGLGVTDVLVEDVVDCARDVAVGGVVKVRTVLGEVTGAASTGSGLSITLDANGDGLFTLDMASAVTAGVGTLHAWADSQAAAGLSSVDVVQDLQLPTVWDQLPAGVTSDLVDELRLVFSEPMRVSTLVPGNFTLVGPAVASVVAVTLENGDTEAVLTIVPPADGALGAWSVFGTDAIRDKAGNRLDGAWAGVRGPYEGVFGAVSSSADTVTCGTVVPDGGVFRPDGDDGSGSEADQFEVDVSTAVAPTWWVVSVTRQSTGALKRRDHLVPAGAAETITWDGRDQAGRILDNGVYLVDVEPLDGFGNRGEGCSVTATVDNRLGALP